MAVLYGTDLRDVTSSSMTTVLQWKDGLYRLVIACWMHCQMFCQSITCTLNDKAMGICVVCVISATLYLLMMHNRYI